MVTALYRRYRPESFADVIGQAHVTEPLMRALRNNRVGHAYLFSGPRGCGKTTSARILARCLNCAEGPTDTPCGTCDSCRDLARGGSGSLDVVEIDAASHGGVDDARELRERATFAPARDRYKIFIIDEAHMVTAAGFNALLKLVEEPPEHVKFVFATTEPEKVIGTIRSRTHHYPFRLVPPQTLIPFLEGMCEQEQVRVERGVLPLVVRAGGGSVRDTLSVLDQLIAGAGERGVGYAMATALLGFTDTDLLDRFVTGIGSADGAEVYGAVERVVATGQEPRRFVEDVLERLRDLIVYAAVPDRPADLLPDVPADQLERMGEQVKLFTPVELSRAGDVVDASLTSMVGATSPRLHLELLCARLLLLSSPAGGENSEPADAKTARSGIEQVRAITRAQAKRNREDAAEEKPAPPVAQPAKRGDAVAAAVAESAAPASDAQERSAQPVAQAQETQSQKTQAQETQEKPVAASPAAAVADWEPAAPAGKRDAAPSQAVAEQAATPESSAPTPAPAASPVRQAPPAVGMAELESHWSAIMDALQLIRRACHALVAQNARVLSFDGQELVLGFRSIGLVNAFMRGANAQNVADAVKKIMRLDVQVFAQVGDQPEPFQSQPQPQTPARPQEASAARESGAGGSVPQRNAAPAQANADAHANAQGQSAQGQGAQRQGALTQSAPVQNAPAPVADLPEPPFDEEPPPEDDAPYPDDYYAAPPVAKSAPPSQARPTAAERAARNAAALRGAAPASHSPQETAKPSAAQADEGAPQPAVVDYGSVQMPPSPGPDGLPDGQPRTHGAGALRAALAAYRDGGNPLTAAAEQLRSLPAAGEQREPQPTTTAAVTAATSQTAPVQSGTGQPAPVQAVPEAEAKLSGAAMAREAARRYAQERQAAAENPDPGYNDETGGASRDDADLDVQSSGIAVVEQVLGGSVIEVLDENGQVVRNR
ncbi:DNA polymerase III subunit gamma and tau [Dermabacteraceae bacterium TAE3-ERU5]|nr:DNA polymerase III subunit gamma and tau [Dermabacteraceae bacterium TAE3-ERU5]